MPYIGTSPSNGVRRVHTYTATAGQTTFTGASNEGQTLSYVDTNYIDVYQNGVLLGTADYTSTSGTSVVLAQGASVSDIIVITVYDVFSVADTVSKTDGGTFDGAVTVNGAFTSQGIDDNADATAITIDSSENVTLSNNLNMTSDDPTITMTDSSGTDDIATIQSTSGALVFTARDGSSDGEIIFKRTDGSSTDESMRIFSSGSVTIAKTATTVATAGHTFFVSGNAGFTKDGGNCFSLNRISDDGKIADFRRDNSEKGSISISGNTTSYNAFTGSHWSRLTDNSKPTILRGTVIETIDEMCDWYQVQFTVEPTDGTSSYVETVNIALPDGASIGDTISYTHEGITYDDAVIIDDGDEKHTKCKISDTEDSTRVYGVFMDWDNDDVEGVNDMYVMAVGTGVVRVSSGETVNAGDLLSSKGDGTAKVQDDDIVRSKTIGKVLTNIKQETYDDGSYTVPCALYCG